MELNAALSPQDKVRVDREVAFHNTKNNAVNGRTAKHEMGKDDFLQLLLAQLAHQDPTSPMENTEFIAQMAQFSSLEQMTNMSAEFTKLSEKLTFSEALSALGKTVELSAGGESVTGTVEGITRGAEPEVMVNGVPYNMDYIKRIYND